MLEVENVMVPALRINNRSVNQTFLEEVLGLKRSWKMVLLQNLQAIQIVKKPNWSWLNRPACGLGPSMVLKKWPD